MSISASIDRPMQLSLPSSGQRDIAPSSAHRPLAPGGLLSVVLNDDEDVEWIWTHYADGRSVVTGYRIMPPHINLPKNNNQAKSGA